VENNPNIKNLVKEKMVSYSARAEQLKQYMASGNVVSTPPPIVKKKSKNEKKTWKKF